MKAGLSVWTTLTVGVCLTAAHPALCADVAIDHIEFVQAVQDHDNNVPLVAGKSTVVRVFLTSSGNDGQDVTSGISGTIVADSLPDALRPFGLPAVAPAGTPDENNQQHSLNFLLPRSWTILTIPLTVHATVTLNNGPGRAQAASATFKAPAGWPSVFRVAHLDVCALDAAGVRQCPPNLGDVSDVMQKTFPLADGAVEYNPVAAGAIDWPGQLGFAPDEQIRFSKFLSGYYFLLEQPVDQLFAWLPSIDGVTGLEAFATGPGHAWWDAFPCPSAPCSTASTLLAGGVSFNVGSASFPDLFNAKVANPAAAAAEYLIIGGTVAVDGSAQLDPGYRVTSAYAGAPSDPIGPYCLRFSGAAAADYCFTPSFSTGFLVKAPFPQGTTRAALVANGSELAALTVSDAPPMVAFVSPSSGDAWQGKRIIQWTGSDPGGATLVYALQYSADNGVTWTPLTLNLTDTQYEVDGTRILGGSQVLFRVLATNGLNTASAVVGPVTVTQSPKLVLGPTPLNFQNVTLGQSVDRTLLLNSSGSGPLTASGQIPGSTYRFVSGSGSLLILPGEQRAVTVRWTPTLTGTQQSTLALTSGDPSLHSVNVTMTGVAFDNPVPSIATSAASLDFGNVNSGQTRDARVTISNGGTATLNVTSISVSSQRYSVVSPAAPAAIPAGQSVDVLVRFSPTGVGTVPSTLSIFSNDPTRSSVTVAMTGLGSVPSPVISVTPSSIDFGPVTVGQTKDAKFTIGNTGTADLTVRSITSGSAVYTVVSPAAPFTLAAGSSTDVTVRFAPVASGQAASSLILSTNDPARLSVTITLSGSSSVNAAPSIAIAPPSLDFGSAAIGQTKDAKFTVNNVGAADLIVTAISGGAGVFSVVSPSTPFSVANGRSVDVTVRFAPTATGPAAASLVVASNDPAKASLPVPVSGSGLGAAASSVLRTIAYHEITAFTAPINIYNLPQISRNGNRAVFTARANELGVNDLSVINTDGTGLKKIDSSIYGNAHFLGLSDDGSRALVWSSQFLRVANADGILGTTVLTVQNDATIQIARLSGDGRTIAFVNARDATFAYSGGPRVAGVGIWEINSDGSNLRQVTAASNIVALLDLAGGLLLATDGGYPSAMDLSSSGGRIVFGANTSTKGRVLLSVNGDGTGLRILRSGLFRLYSVAISGDGSTVGYSTAPTQVGAPELNVIHFDGGAAATIATRLTAVSMQLSNDGSLLFAGDRGSGVLARTDGSSLVVLFAPAWGVAGQLGVENDDFNRATMNGAGTRFLFTVPDLKYQQTGFFQLAMADLNPNALGAAPAIASPAVSPASIPGDGAGYSVNVSGTVTSATSLTAGSAQSLFQGLPDVPGTVLTDLGGGSWSGSLFFATTTPGPRTIRVKEETVGADGKRHATAVDIGGFSVASK